MRLPAIAALGASLLLPVVANGATTVSAHKINIADEGSAVAVLKDGRICRKRTETGTRLGGHTDCRTKKEWDDLERAARADTELHQRTGMNGAIQ